MLTFPQVITFIQGRRKIVRRDVKRNQKNNAPEFLFIFTVKKFLGNFFSLEKILRIFLKNS